LNYRLPAGLPSPFFSLRCSFFITLPFLKTPTDSGTKLSPGDRTMMIANPSAHSPLYTSFHGLSRPFSHPFLAEATVILPKEGRAANFFTHETINLLLTP